MLHMVNLYNLKHYTYNIKVMILMIKQYIPK